MRGLSQNRPLQAECTETSPFVSVRPKPHQYSDTFDEFEKRIAEERTEAAEKVRGHSARAEESLRSIAEIRSTAVRILNVTIPDIEKRFRLDALRGHISRYDAQTFFPGLLVMFVIFFSYLMTWHKQKTVHHG